MRRHTLSNIWIAVSILLPVAACISLPESTPPVPTAAPITAQAPANVSLCAIYTLAQEAAMASAIASLPTGSPLIGAMTDYHNERVSDGCPGAK